jgi:pilus assembly protein TadC
MERWFGPLVFGASGAFFGLWALRADFRRMGFAGPRQSLGPAGAGRISGRLKRAFLWVALALMGCLFGRKALLAVGIAYVAQHAFRDHKRKRRLREIRREWPFLIESMAVATLSGMGPGDAFQSAAKRARGAMREETDKVVLRLMGGASLSGALSAMEGCGLPDVRRLRALLSQSEILGTPVADMLKRLSEEGYDEERRLMEERFNALPVKLSAITVFFLLPPVLAVSVMPHILAFIEAGW